MNIKFLSINGLNAYVGGDCVRPSSSWWIKCGGGGGGSGSSATSSRAEEGRDGGGGGGRSGLGLRIDTCTGLDETCRCGGQDDPGGSGAGGFLPILPLVKAGTDVLAPEDVVELAEVTRLDRCGFRFINSWADASIRSISWSGLMVPVAQAARKWGFFGGRSGGTRPPFPAAGVTGGQADSGPAGRLFLYPPDSTATRAAFELSNEIENREKWVYCLFVNQ